MDNNLFIDISERKDKDERSLRKYNKDTIVLDVGDSDFSTPPVIVNAIIENIKLGDFSYNKGTELVPIIKKYLKTRDMINDPHNLSINLTSGTIFSLQVAINMHTKLGDFILIPNPIYNPFKGIIEKMGRKVSYFNVDKEINFSEMKELVIKNNIKLLLFCNPNNPMGRSFKKKELEKIKDIIYKNNGYIYSDEVWCELDFSGEFIPFASIDESEHSRIVSVNNLGKTFNIHSLHFAYMYTFNKKLSEKIENQRRISLYSTHISQINIYAVKSCLSNIGYEWIEKYRSLIKSNHKLLKENIKNSIIVPKLNSTHVVWLNFNKVNLSNSEIESIFRKNNIILSPGSKYGSGFDKFYRITISISPKKLLSFSNILNNIPEFA